jgi:hypothetical protein
MTFNALEYTRDSLAKELYLIELHSKDGSAVDGGCTCIEEKHLLGVEALAEEGSLLATEKAERDYYTHLAEIARKARKDILDGNFNPGTEKLKHLFKGDTLNGYTEAAKCRSIVECIKKCPECKKDKMSEECRACAADALS